MDREPFFYNVHISEREFQGKYNYIDKVQRNGLDIKKFVSKDSAGEFEWDSKGEYGPFGSFYAAFDCNGNMRYHMNARDLTKNIDGQIVIDENGLRIPNGRYSKEYSLMWVVPKLFLSSDEENLIISNFSDDNNAFAHSIDLNGDGDAEITFDYLAFGVYPTKIVRNKAYSMQGVKPTNNKSILQFDKVSNNYELSSINPGYSMQCNWYQWSLLEHCTSIALGTYEHSLFSSGVYGDICDNGKTAIAKNGYYSEVIDTRKNKEGSSERIFVENAWSNIGTWISGTLFRPDGLYASRTLPCSYYTSSKDLVKILDFKNRFLVAHLNSRLFDTETTETWGFPVVDGGDFIGHFSNQLTITDSHPIGAAYVNFIKGSWSGIRKLNVNYSIADTSDKIGSRLTFLFNKDAASDGAVSLPGDDEKPFYIPKIVNENNPIRKKLSINEEMMIRLKNAQIKSKTPNNRVITNKKSVPSTTKLSKNNIKPKTKMPLSNNPYEDKFKLMFKEIDLSIAVADPIIIVGAMADLNFVKVDINTMRTIVYDSPHLVIKILRKEKCDIKSISKTISDNTAIDVRKIELLLSGLYNSII